ncbi:MAG: hypothetical protein ACP5IE_03145 [Infirmifilum sp.]
MRPVTSRGPMWGCPLRLASFIILGIGYEYLAELGVGAVGFH